MDRRSFLRVSGGSIAIAMVPMAGCSSGASVPPVESTGGPTGFLLGTRFETRPNEHGLLVDGARIGTLGSNPGQFNYPLGIAISGGLAYVVDSGNHRVQVLDRSGATVGLLGETELLYPGGISATAAGELLVADSRNARIVAFSPDGDVTRTFGEGVLSAPRGIAAIGDTVLVADAGRRQVLELDDSGTVRRSFGADWVLPYAVATDGESVFVADGATAEIVMFDRTGRRQESIPLERAVSHVSFGVDGILYVS